MYLIYKLKHNIYDGSMENDDIRAPKIWLCSRVNTKMGELYCERECIYVERETRVNYSYWDEVIEMMMVVVIGGNGISDVHALSFNLPPKSRVSFVQWNDQSE